MTMTPDFVTERHLEYLDALRESGAVNMFGATSYLENRFDLKQNIARKILAYWMQTFSERHPDAQCHTLTEKEK